MLTTRKRLVAIAALTGAVGAAFVIGSAAASADRAYTLRLGDRIVVPAVDETCVVSTEGGAADLVCARRRRPHHQVVIFRNRIQVWKAGNPAAPVWSGRP